MKILLCHNFYGSSAPSGENTVVLSEKKLLRKHGHEIVEFCRYSDDIRGTGIRGLLKGACCTPWNPISKIELHRVLNACKPDVMHVHNTFPLLSPSIFYAAKNLDTAIVFTLHNYRVFCAAGIPMRNGLPCTECMDQKTVFPALKYGCYRNARITTIPVVGKIALHRLLGTWQTQVDAFIALTAFQKNEMIKAGLPEDRIHIKPHFYANPPNPCEWRERGEKIVYIGRLSAEKGVHILLDVWQRWGTVAPLLEIVGDGPLKGDLEKQADAKGLAGKVRFCGQLAFNETQKLLARASLLILPSLWFEGFPMVIREAFALGVPVAASRLGSMPDIVTDGENGILFSPGNVQEIIEKMDLLWRKPKLLASMANNARKEFEAHYTAEQNYEKLIEIYKNALSSNSHFS